MRFIVGLDSRSIVTQVVTFGPIKLMMADEHAYMHSSERVSPTIALVPS